MIDHAKIREWIAASGAQHYCIEDNTAELTRFADLVRAHVIAECAEECDVAARYYEDADRVDTAQRIARVFRAWIAPCASSAR